jgi:hypothetical protein
MGEPLGKGKREWGGGRGGEGQYTANLGSEWTGTHATTKEGFQVSKGTVLGTGEGFPSNKGVIKRIGHAPPCIYIVLIVYMSC